MAAYVLARKDVKYRNGMAFFIFFTTLFNAGLVPYYIFMIQYLHMKNSILALILPNLFNVMYILIMRTNIANNIPDSIPESAKIDGANDFSIYLKIILPLSKPVLASIGLFVTLMYWNDWWNAMLFITNDKIFPLQYILYRILTYSMYAQELLKKSGALVQLDMPKESLKLALTVITTGPIVLAYPFAQKYFVAGITIGAVKG
jgi:putative aldouronate transport system permease protein